jgi:hypothetical protein
MFILKEVNWLFGLLVLLLTIVLRQLHVLCCGKSAENNCSLPVVMYKRLVCHYENLQKKRNKNIWYLIILPILVNIFRNETLEFLSKNIKINPSKMDIKSNFAFTSALKNVVNLVSTVSSGALQVAEPNFMYELVCINIYGSFASIFLSVICTVGNNVHYCQMPA